MQWTITMKHTVARNFFVLLQSAHTKFDPVLYKQKYVCEQAENSRYETLLNHQAMWTNAC